jgi:CheY-like chemotaxis protein
MVRFANIGQSVFRDYIRSAVIIDDRWPEDELALNDDDLGNLDLLAGAVPQDDIYAVNLALTGEVAKPVPDDAVDAEVLERLRRELLRQGILACGLRYQQRDRTTAIRLARSADIVVLDWHLVDDDGAEALEILRPLMGDCIRFVCIWTGHGRVEEVRSRLIRDLGSLKEQPDGEDRKADLRIENLVIAIRIKEGINIEPELAVSPENLLETAIQGLVHSFGGLVQLAVLEMTNRHRQHLPEILEHIGRPIDTAVLLDASNSEGSAGPEGALLAVLVDEWRSRLERDFGKLISLSKEGRQAFGAELRDARSEGWTEKMTGLLVKYGAQPKDAKKCTDALAPLVGDWLERGCEGDLPDIKKVSPPKVSPHLVIWAALLATVRADTDPDPLFRLDSLLHQQFNPTTSLTQGSVVKVQRGETTQYLVCTTPLCDADRPEKIGKLFTFVRTSIVPTEEILRGKGIDHYCIVKDENEFICLAVLIKERVSLEIDEPRFDTFGIVRAQLSLGGIRDQEGPSGDALEIHRVAQLRLEHAFALTAATSADASRIGVSKVELVRSRIRKQH